MKIIKEVCYRCLILFVMLSLTMVAYDMSKPVLISESQILPRDIVECIVHPFSTLPNDENEKIDQSSAEGYSFLSNMLMPIIIYLISIGGFMVLLIEDFKLIKTFTYKNRLAGYLWKLWIVVLICFILIPIFFGLQLIMKSFMLAVMATAIFLVLVGILYALSCKAMKTYKKP